MGADFTFTPPINPSQKSTPKKVKPRVNKIAFGDGYEQRSGDGINNIIRTRTLFFEALTESQKDTIETFLEAREGKEQFFYTLPDESTQRQWVCEEWDISSNNNIYNLSMKIKEDFTI